MNTFILETDYPDLATFERETVQFESNPELTSIWSRAAALIIEGSGREELLASAPGTT